MSLLTTSRRSLIGLAVAVAVILAAALLPSFVLAAENDDLKANLCGGANLSLSEGGNDSDGFNRSCTNPSDGSGAPKDGLEAAVAFVLNTLSLVVGIIAVFMIIIGGFRYVTSGGDSGKVTSAKNTIIYALVGLVIAALAQVIVQYVITKSATV